MNFNEIAAAIQARLFLPGKPIRKIRPSDLARDPRIVASRKYNGHFATAVVGAAGAVEFYTASNLYLTSLRGSEWFEDGDWKCALNEAAPGTIFLGELFIPRPGIEDLRAFQTWFTWHRESRGATPPHAKFLAFDALTIGGRPLHHSAYEERYHTIPSALRVAAVAYRHLGEADDALRACGLSCEGFVFWEAAAPSLCKIGGRHQARGAAWKVKPVHKAAFVLRGLLNAEPCSLVMRLGTDDQPDFPCGSGLTFAERRELVAAFKARKRVYVDVLHYGYDETGRLEMPRASAWRAF